MQQSTCRARRSFSCDLYAQQRMPLERVTYFFYRVVMVKAKLSSKCLNLYNNNYLPFLEQIWLHTFLKGISGQFDESRFLIIIYKSRFLNICLAKKMIDLLVSDTLLVHL